jgi:hypothetical protein
MKPVFFWSLLAGFLAGILTWIHRELAARGVW